MTCEWALITALLFVLLAGSTVAFLVRILKKHGYRKSDIKQIDEILEEHWNEPWDWGYLKYDVKHCIIYHLVLWGFLSSALLEFRNFSLVIVALIGFGFLLLMAYPFFATSKLLLWISDYPGRERDPVDSRPSLKNVWFL